MARFFEMPQASPTMESGVLLSWKKNEGDKLVPGDAVAEVETDKAAMDIEVFDNAYLLKILVPAGEDVPAGQRAVLVLRYWEDRSIEETARLLGTSEGNVKSQSSRGLTALRSALAERGIVTEPMPEEAQT